MGPSTNTVASIAIGVPAAIILTWLLKTCCHLDVPQEVQSSLSVVISAAAGWVAEYISNKRKSNG